MARLTYLIDNSAFMRAVRLAEVQKVVDPLVARRQIARCTMFEMEALWSARPKDYEAVATRLHAFPLVPTHQVDWDRAAEVMALLAGTGRHRSVPIPDLIVAAIAERAQLTVLHYDGAFDAIASVTGQPMEAVAPLGSVP
ncbi:MAG: PIN domain-containing protein [Candidatus Dormiibacterota bacterium]